MSIINMPMFELFLPLLKNKKIEKWTASVVWKNLELNTKERNHLNRQRMYRLLRKLVKYGFLTKEIHPKNPCLSTFSETYKINKLRKFNYFSFDFFQMTYSQEETKKSIFTLEKKLQGFDILEKNFQTQLFKSTFRNRNVWKN